MIPKGAQYYLPMKDGKTAQKFYRIVLTKWNDGTKTSVLEYYSECGSGWMNSDKNSNEKTRNEFISTLIKIENKI